MTAHSRSIIHLLLRAKGFRIPQLQKALDCSQPTACKYAREPLYMNGHDRIKLAALLGLKLRVVDMVINGEFTEVQQVWDENKRSENHTVTR